MPDQFWEQLDVVEQFAAREPDHRLAEMLGEYEEPAQVRVLDLGCAGGRNTILLARHRFQVWAVDASTAMVDRTRERMAEIVGPGLARKRVLHGEMDDLSRFQGGWFDLVVALGIYHNARSRSEWESAVAETARVLKRGGRLLVNHFTPEVDLTGEGVRPIPGTEDEYQGFPGGNVVLFETEALDEAIGRHGFHPQVPSRTVRVEAPPGRRVSTNALYVRTRE